MPAHGGFVPDPETHPRGLLLAGGGARAPGLGYVGGVSGGLAFGLRDFWPRHPTQLDIRGAAGNLAFVTLWLWTPDATPMNLRFSHQGMGMDTHAKELERLEITYEDDEKGFDTAQGVARTKQHRAVRAGGDPEPLPGRQ